jgi:hypothetical protein
VELTGDVPDAACLEGGHSARDERDVRSLERRKVLVAAHGSFGEIRRARSERLVHLRVVTERLGEMTLATFQRLAVGRRTGLDDAPSEPVGFLLGK